MTRIDFYILPEPGFDRVQRLACRLTEKAWQNGLTVFVNAASELEARHTDDLLWTYRQDSFVPHALYEKDTGELPPVVVGDGVEPDTPSDVLINLTRGVPPFFERFDRVIEFVGGDAADRQQGRERYRLYRDRGCQLQTHNL